MWWLIGITLLTLLPTSINCEWVSYEGFDSFPGQNVGNSLTGTVSAAQSSADSNNYPGFVYCGNIAYFRSQSVALLVQNRQINTGCALWVKQITTPTPTPTPTRTPPTTPAPATTACGTASPAVNIVDDYIYRVITSTGSSNSLLLSIKAGHDAHIGLGSSTSIFRDPSSGKAFYEIFIGGYSNTLTAIRKISGRDLLASGRNNAFLSPTEYRNFWISWTGDIIRVGSGTTIGSNIICTYQDPSPYPVSYYALAAYGGKGQSASYIVSQCTYVAPPTIPPAPGKWTPPPQYATALANIWKRYETKYWNGQGPFAFHNYIWDQIVAGRGNINYCVRWESTTTVDVTLRDRIHNNLARTFNQWIAVLQDAPDWSGFGFPYQSVNVKVVGWAVKNRDQLQWSDNSVDVYVNNLDGNGIPQCAPACGRFFHQDGNYGGCPGGAARHYDLSFWLTQGGGFGAAGHGGDWGQRLILEDVLRMLDNPNMHVLQHEIGHGFGLDDFYDWDPLPGEGFVMKAGSATKITPFDIWMLRDWWTHFKAVGRYTSAGIRAVEVVDPNQPPPTLHFEDALEAWGPTENQSTNHAININLIIGVVIGGVVLITSIIGMITYRRYKRHQDTVTHMQTTTANPLSETEMARTAVVDPTIV